MIAAPRPLVLVVERTVLAAWSVVEVLAEVTVTVVEVREARRRRVRPRSAGPADHGDVAAAGLAWPAPCRAPSTARSLTSGGSLRV